MRRTIETVPRDGSVVIIEDDASVSYDLAHWSPEAGQWVGEGGEPSKITPTHWHPLPGENYLQHGHDIFEAQTAPVEAKRVRRFAVFSIAATFVAAALIGTYFRAEIAAYVTPYPDQDRQVVGQETQLPSQDSRKTDSSALQHAKAQAGGIQGARDRFNALSR